MAVVVSLIGVCCPIVAEFFVAHTSLFDGSGACRPSCWQVYYLQLPCLSAGHGVCCTVVGNYINTFAE